MRELAKICRVLMWGVLAVGVLFQSLSIAGIEYQKELGMQRGMGGNNVNTMWLGLVMVAMVLAVLAFVLMKRWKAIPLVLAFLVAIGIVVVAYYIDITINGHALPGVQAHSNSPYDLTVWEIIYRNALLAIEPLLMIPLYLVYREDLREAKYAEEHEQVPSILDGMGDFQLSKLSEEDERPQPKKHKR